MKRYILIAALMIMTFFCQAQMTLGLNKDSLRHLLGQTSQDTTRVLLLITIGQQYESSDPDSALYFYSLAGSLSKELNYIEGELRYINNYTAVMNVPGKLQESTALLLQAVRICEQHNLPVFQMKVYRNLGAVYQYQKTIPTR